MHGHSPVLEADSSRRDATEAALGRLVPLGQFVGVYGVRGWLRLRSDTDPVTNILDYQPWYLGADGGRRLELLEAKLQPKGLVVRLAGVRDRDEAEALRGLTVSVPRTALPAPAGDEFYWFDLIGLEVLTLDARSLGRIERLFATGSNDVLVVQGDRERYVPFIRDQVVHEVDLAAGWLRVDWDPDF